MGLFEKNKHKTKEALVAADLAVTLIARKYTPIEVEFVEYNNSVKVAIGSTITLSDLKTIAEFFGSEAIDIDGRHGEGSYDCGFEAELTIYNPTKNTP